MWKDSNQKRWTSSRETTNLYHHAGRTKSCKKDSRYPPLCTKRWERPQARISTKFTRRERRSPRSSFRCRSSTRFLEYYRRFTYIYRNHVAPRTKLCVPKDDLPIPLNYIDVQRQKKAIIDVLHEATIGDYCNSDGDRSLSEPWIGVTRFELLNKKPEGDNVGSRQTEKETGYCKTWKYLVGRIVKRDKKHSAQSHEQMDRVKKQIGRCKRATRNLLHSRRLSCKWGNHEQRQKNMRKYEERHWCLAKSPNQPTRTVQTGSDLVQVIGQRWKRKDWIFHAQREIMRTESLNREEFALQREKKRLTRTASRTEVKFPFRATTWWTNRFPD